MSLVLERNSAATFWPPESLKAPLPERSFVQLIAPLDKELVPLKAALLIASKRSLLHRIKVNAYHLSYNGCAMCVGVERGSAWSPSPPSSPPYIHHHHHLRYHHYIHRGEADRHFHYAGRFTCRAAGRLVRMVHALLRSAAIPGRRTIWRAHGRVTGPTRAVRTSARLSCGVTTSEKLSATRMASGSCKAAMMVMRFARARGRLPAPLHSGTHMHQRSRG